jgi:hypothetical protein
MGLVDATSGVRKKAWYSFRLLNQKIEGFSSASLVSVGTATDDNVTGGAGVWVVRFDFADGTRRWAAWSPNNQTATLTGLTGLGGLALTTVVPSSLSSDGLTATWTSSSITVSGDSASIPLADAPVLIELVPRFTVWQQAHFSAAELADTAVSGDTADPDADGLANLIEYALGSDPRVPSSGVAPAVGTDVGASDGLAHLVLTLHLDAGATDITPFAEVSGDLQTWQSGSGFTGVVSDTTASNVRTLVIRDNIALDTAGRRFIRLKVTRP